ncbi:Autophagy protein Apg16 [Rasamsonia emersonii CBS 393.64]|uniref:Autophagy protein Apg16 n=1 Tax=Rasamsonia emersonii (strain ATCC 16479 / CBS 393.64 / IMI 116815) TaxID=1408163 RepID=A0A0F4Z345_RASE3|nr:Autophagy protein Apg16 [Rasamsonia emersonii CBS 393.64]KKA24293.1 Autophagy protein Apg16 [Rasamsonia emersonii CBS 393.64]
MANWRDDYYAALGVRDEREKANIGLYDAYRTGALATARQQVQSSEAAAAPSSSATSKRGATTGQQQDAGKPLHEVLAAVRADLTAAQRSRSELQDRLTRTTEELEKLKKKTQQDGRRITALEGERHHLQLRLRDRDEELRGKAKLLDSVQDELASLNLQLNMAEERSSRLQRENQELIDRWMAHKGKEAEAMNEASKFS